MDGDSKHLAPDAIVLLANFKQAIPGWRHSIGWVGSRMMLWCISGKGSIVANGQRHEFRPGRFLFLPWGHSIEYHAAHSNPFLLGGLHIIPEHDRWVEPEYYVVHTDRDRSARNPERRDVRLQGLKLAIAGRLEDIPGLTGLLDYAVKWYAGRQRDQDTARSLGRMILCEMIGASRDPESATVMLPNRLRRIMDYVKERIHRQISIHDLEEVGRCSGPTISRLFQKHIRIPPMAWVIKQKMDKACELLSTTEFPIGEVGARVGVDDQFYFSKLFKKHAGVTATDYRKRNGLLSMQPPESSVRS